MTQADCVCAPANVRGVRARWRWPVRIRPRSAGSACLAPASSNPGRSIACLAQPPTLPHRAGEDQRRVVQVPHLQQLPDHHRFEHRADAARRDDEGVGREHEVMQAREERLVFEELSTYGFAACSNGSVTRMPTLCTRSGAGIPRAFVRGLHQSWSAAGDDVAAHRAQGRAHALDFLVHPVPGCVRAEPNTVTR